MMATQPTAAGDMGSRTPIGRVVHTIHAVEDIAACRALYLDALGGIIFAEGYFEAEDRDMALLYVADYSIEPMAPRDPERLAMPFARYLKRNGQCLHSIEIHVDDARALSAKLEAAGCRLATNYGIFFFVRPESTGGILLEVTEVRMPNDPYDRPNWRSDWADGQESTLQRLDHVACVTRDADAAVAFFTTHLDGELRSDERTAQPQPGRRVVLRLGGTDVAFTQPDDPADGPLGAFLSAPNSGVYAQVWRVGDEASAEAFFHGKGLRTTRQGCAASGFAIEPADFFGARHEFVSRGR